MEGCRMNSQELAGITNSLLAFFTLCVLAVYVYLAYLTRQQVKASQGQVRATQDTLEASQRPFLFPNSTLTLVSGEGYGRRFEFEGQDPGQKITLRNGGTGIALNVYAALVEPHPRSDAGVVHNPRMRSVVFDAPLPIGEEFTEDSKGGPFSFGWDTFAGDDPRNTLSAPQIPTPAEQRQQQTYRVVVRLTITYDDISGKTHASQFDYIDQGRWVFHAFLPKITAGIEAIGRSAELRSHASQIALQRELELGRNSIGKQ
jgi:hypothetical protein